MHPLKEYRLDRGLTQAALAQLVGTKKGTVSKWEQGTVPSLKFMRRIAEVTDGAVTANDFYDAALERQEAVG